MIEIRPVQSTHELPKAAALFREYADSLGFDLAFQNFERELETLPGAYGPPAGAILLAWDGPRPAGCVAMRPHDSLTCEMKRFFVRPAHRGRGIGRMLATGLIDAARRTGYTRMLLDTVPQMSAAIALYESLGFREVPPYVFNPLPGARFFELMLNT